MSPTAYLYVVVLVTIGAYAVNRFYRRREQCELKKVAAEFDLNYCPIDEFKLARKVADAFPICGAAGLTIKDLMYGVHGDHHRYVFTAEYTIGAVRMKKRVRCVAACNEPLTQRQTDIATDVQLAPTGLEWHEQYRAMAKQD